MLAYISTERLLMLYSNGSTDAVTNASNNFKSELTNESELTGRGVVRANAKLSGRGGSGLPLARRVGIPAAIDVFRSHASIPIASPLVLH